MSENDELTLTVQAIDTVWRACYGDECESSASPTAARNRVNLLAEDLKCGRANFSAANKAYVELDRRVNTPELEDFDAGVQRWGEAHDRSKSAENWFWLVGYLAGKALRASIDGDREKALHHTISAAGALRNWHRAIQQDTSGAGIGRDDDLQPDSPIRAAAEA